MFFSEHTQFVPIPEEFMEFGILWEPNSTYPALPLFLDFPEQVPWTAGWQEDVSRMKRKI